MFNTENKHAEGKKVFHFSILNAEQMVNDSERGPAFKVALHNVQFVKYDVTVSFMAQVLDTVT